MYCICLLDIREIFRHIDQLRPHLTSGEPETLIEAGAEDTWTMFPTVRLWSRSRLRQNQLMQRPLFFNLLPAHTSLFMQPCVYVNGLEALSDCIMYIWIVTIVKPQSQQSVRGREGQREGGREGERGQFVGRTQPDPPVAETPDATDQTTVDPLAESPESQSDSGEQTTTPSVHRSTRVKHPPDKYERQSIQTCICIVRFGFE